VELDLLVVASPMLLISNTNINLSDLYLRVMYAIVVDRKVRHYFLPERGCLHAQSRSLDTGMPHK
jgi:hypothetical protein